MARGVALPDSPGSVGARRGLLVALLVFTTALAGCHGDVPEPAATPPDPAPTASAPPLPEAVRLPDVQLDAATTGANATLHIHVDGDPTLIRSHAVDWGDGAKMRTRDGAPPLRYTHEYPQPPDWRFEPMTYTATLTLQGAFGNARNVQVPVVIDPPPNRPPVATLRPEDPLAEVPARITFLLSATDTDGKIASWRFAPGDDAPPAMDSGTPIASYSHTYDRIGTYTATFAVTDDAGATVDTTTTVRVLPPQDRAVWSLSSHNGTAYRADGNGGILDNHRLIGPCVFEDRCPRIVDALAHDDALVVLIDEVDTSRLLVLDGAAGHIRHQQTLGAAAQHLAVDAEGRFWITHRDGTITWTYGDTQPRSVQVPADQADIRMAFSPTTTWALVSDRTARLYQIDPVTGQASLLFLPNAAPARLIAANAKHDMVVVVDQAGRAHVAAQTLYGPRLVHVGLLEGGTPVGIACPPADDRCWVALDGADGSLVALDLTGLPRVATPTAAVVFGPDVRPAGVFVAHQNLLVPTTGPNNTTYLIDPTNGQVTAALASPRDTTADGVAAHPQHPRLVYLGEGHGWNIIDLKERRVVHTSSETGGDLGPYLVALPRAA